MRWLEAERGLAFGGDYARALAVVGRRPRGLLGLDLGLLRAFAPRRRYERGARLARDARRRVVSGGAGSTTPSTCFRGKPRRRGSRSATPPSCATLEPADLGRAARAGRAAAPRGCGRSGSGAATASSPTCRTSPRRWSPSSPPPRSARSGRSCSPDFGAAQRRRPLRPDRAQGAARGRRLPLRRQGLRPHRDRRRACAAEMPALERTVVVPYLRRRPRPGGPARGRSPGTTCSRSTREPSFASSASPFDHPLWVLYSSGTTGLPKAIVQGHGGILLEQLKKLHLHLDAQAGDRVFWFTTTGWMMWNFLVGGAAHATPRSCSTTAAPGTPTWACSGTSPSAPG